MMLVARARTAAALAAALMLAAGCGSGQDSDGPEAGESVGGSLATMSGWLGCEVFADLQPVQEYLGVTAVDGQLQSDGIGEGIDAEAAGCSGLFDLATFEDVQGTFEYRVTGDAAIRAGLAPWPTDEEAQANFEDRVDVRRQNLPGIEFTDEHEGELGGAWDDSRSFSAVTEHRHYIDAYGRSGSWVVYISIDYLHDPGVGAYESAPEFYPDSSPEAMAVYPFTADQVVEWVTQEYLPALQSDIIERAESE
ncbi:hypothetical protein GCM10028833_16870 [Glycomyces tarimensis]